MLLIGIKETHTVNNVTSVDGLVNAFTNQGLNCNVIKTKSINDLKELHKDKRHNIILHMFIKNNYHYAYIKEVKKKGILFNNDLFIPFDFLKVCYTGISIIISNSSSLNFSCFGVSVNKSKWTNITGKVTQRDLFNHYFGMVGEAIILNKEYVKLKANIKDESNRKGIESLEFILFGDTLKPKMVNLLRIQKQLSPVNNHNVSMKLYNQSQEKYILYDISRLQKLSSEIITTLNNIDNEINTSLSSDVSDLTKKINFLNIKNIKNPFKEVNNALNSNDKCFIVVNGYSKTFENYLIKINEYVKLKNTLQNNSEINNINIDDSIINSIHSKIILLDSLKQRFNLIKKDLKIIENIFKTKKLYDTKI